MGKIRRKMNVNVYEESSQSGGKQFSKFSIFDFSRCSKEIIEFNPMDFLGTVRFNIIPHEIKTKRHPLFLKYGKGELVYTTEIFVHPGIGAENEDVVCLKKNYGQDCPACNELFRLRDANQQEESKKYEWARRFFYNIQLIIDGKSQPLNIFVSNNKYFESKLIRKARACTNGEDIITFADIENGKIIECDVYSADFTAANGKKSKYPEYENFRFIDRREELEDEIIDEAISFDKYLKVLNYEEFERLLFSGSIEEDEEEKEVEDTKKEKSSTKKSQKNECPYNHEWGEADDHKECKKCDEWDECVEEQE
jgi:hypothetical protein